MEHNHPINEINSRAQVIGLPIRELCEAARINWSTYWRWQQPDANPRMRDMQSALESLDRVLSQRELAVLSVLVSRYPEAAQKLIEETDK